MSFADVARVSFAKNFLLLTLVAALFPACQTGDGSSPGDADAPNGQPAAQSDIDVAPSTDAPAAAEAPGAPAPPPAAVHPDSSDRKFFFAQPEKVRGLYVNAWFAGSRKQLAKLIGLAKRTEINSFVIDVKDATGYVSHASGVPLAREIGAAGEIRIRKLSYLLGELEAAGIYPIARIVIAKDPLLAAARPDLVVQDTAGGVWLDNKDAAWLNPYQREVWDYHVALAREAAAWGFPEIQWDYVRFPDAPASELARAHYPGSNGQPKADAIRDFLAHSRDALADMDVRITADVFGVTTSAPHDVGVGQVWESFIDVVDAALPMVYPSHYREGDFDVDAPNAYPYETVRAALKDVLRRSAAIPGAGATRPWLQDFSLGEPPYGAAEVRAQIQATYDAGIEEWILWNAGSSYTEEALEPLSGFTNEPLLRIANQLVPAARRHEALLDSTVVPVDEDTPEEPEASPEKVDEPPQNEPSQVD